jgi:hypothetical protein
MGQMEKVRTSVNLTFLKAQKHLVLRSEYVIVPVQLERRIFGQPDKIILAVVDNSKGKTCMVELEEQSHVKQLYLNHMCKIGLRVWNSHKVGYHIVCPLVDIWDPPTPLPLANVPPPRNLRGGGYTLACLGGGGGWGSPNSDDWRKSLALCLLCACMHSP